MNAIGQKRMSAGASCALAFSCALLICWLSPGTTRADQLTPAPEIISAQATAIPVAVKTGANLRAGPGTNYPRIGGAKAGQVIEIVARNPAGDWYQLTSGAWIFGNLVENAPNVPVVTNIPTPPGATPGPVPSVAVTAAINGAQQVSVKVVTGANLRASPGTNYPKVGAAKAGQSLAIVARNPAGDWYQTATGEWIFGELLDSAPAVPVAASIPAPPEATASPPGTAEMPSTDGDGTGVRSGRQGTFAASIRRLLNGDSLLEFVFSTPLAIIPALILLGLCLLVLRLLLRRYESGSSGGYSPGPQRSYGSPGYGSLPRYSSSSSDSHDGSGLTWSERQYEGYDQYERDRRRQREQEQREQDDRAWEAREAERQERYEQEADIAQEKEQAKWDAWHEQEQARWEAYDEREQAKWDAYYENQRQKYYGDDDE